MSSIRPGQTNPNEFECAILRHIAKYESLTVDSIATLHVLSREFTGVGSFTRFQCAEDAEPKRRLGMHALINMPGIPNGMGATLLCAGLLPKELEIFTYGDDLWDGVYDGFTIGGSN